MNPETEYREGLEQLASHYKEVLSLLGEDPTREGLEKTPMRVAKAMQVLTRGYGMDAHKVLTDALFKEDYSQMVIVKDIDFFSHAAILRKGARGLYSKRIHHRTEQNSSRGGHLLSQTSGAGKNDPANKGVYRANPQTTRSDGRGGG